MSRPLTPRKLVHIRRSTRAFGTSTRGPSKILNRGPSDITLRHCPKPLKVKTSLQTDGMFLRLRFETGFLQQECRHYHNYKLQGYVLQKHRVTVPGADQSSYLSPEVSGGATGRTLIFKII
jgi:hypothetical protein